MLDAVLAGGQQPAGWEGTAESGSFMWGHVPADDLDTLVKYKIQRVCSQERACVTGGGQNDHLVYELMWNEVDSHIVMDLEFRCRNIGMIRLSWVQRWLPVD